MLGVLAVLALAGSWALSRPSSARPTSRPAAWPSPSPTPARAGETIAAQPARPAATRVWPADPLDFRDGVLTYGGARYALGQPGDALVAGDWRCTGRPTLALLRRGNGDVFAFDGWPDGEQTLTARSVGQVEGATGLRAVDRDGDGCPELEVERAGAVPVRLRVAS